MDKVIQNIKNGDILELSHHSSNDESISFFEYYPVTNVKDTLYVCSVKDNYFDIIDPLRDFLSSFEDVPNITISKLHVITYQNNVLYFPNFWVYGIEHYSGEVIYTVSESTFKLYEWSEIPNNIFISINDNLIFKKNGQIVSCFKTKNKKLDLFMKTESFAFPTIEKSIEEAKKLIANNDYKLSKEFIIKDTKNMNPSS